MLLDKPQRHEEREKLKCENCGMSYNDKLNWESIDESGLCEWCFKHN
jgi:protein-arginine kinase activator protein McsA